MLFPIFLPRTDPLSDLLSTTRNAWDESGSQQPGVIRTIPCEFVNTLPLGTVDRKNLVTCENT